MRAPWLRPIAEAAQVHQHVLMQVQTLSSWSGRALALREALIQPRSPTRESATVESKIDGSYYEFLFPGLSSLPSWTFPLSFVEGVCTCFSSSPSQTDQDGRDVGVGGWCWCLRVIDVDVCWDGADEPNQFST